MESRYDGPNTIVIKITGGDFNVSLAIELFAFEGVFDLLFRLLGSLWFDLIWFYSQRVDACRGECFGTLLRTMVMALFPAGMAGYFGQWYLLF